MYTKKSVSNNIITNVQYSYQILNY